jgi:hypothetical protein
MSPSSKLKKIVLVACVLGGSIAGAYALTISPARYDLAADKGTTVEGDFMLVNEQSDTATFYTSVQNFEAEGETGTPSFTDSKTGLASWVHVQDSITLKKGEKQTVHFSISVPSDAEAGGHFAAIFMSTVPASSNSASGVSVGAKVGMLVLLKVNGDIKEGGGVASFGTEDGSHIITSLPVTFVYRFTNSGNDRVNPTGEISIRNTLGLETDKLNANEMSGNILPNSTRKFEVVWGSGEKLPENASFFEQVRYEMAHFALGFYSAKMALSFGSTGSSLSSVWFIVLPWHLLSVIVVVLLFIFFIGRAFLKRYNRWIIQQAQLHARQ